MSEPTKPADPAPLAGRTGSEADSDPYESAEYQKFVEESAKECRCHPDWGRPCDGVLAGGLCDGLGHDPDFTMDDLEWSEEYE